ncbi:4-hydroxybenzoate 3-monooxygenase [Propylenella binzhouense]|uniref:4-hydroxybenzoate 3-monooxygenase n=1 Tax=Propylenella binzhouense TaxID=2555902 RepID=A0A964WUV7_9HYPH|nr:4-hydroxybenzoate 3-monooxygenase [Propylenella binzhouense]MYZ49235.1 4-hydroxybenzoate 3-monooxygenase [Propylenella binzhouense]
MRTQVGILGAGPAGLLLSHLLHLEGIDSVVLEDRSRSYVENRIRAGVLEQVTVDLLNDTGLGERMQREGLVHHGVEFAFAGRRHRIDFADLTGGKAITVYGQHEVVRDMIAARLAAGGQILFEARATAVEDIESERPRIRYEHEGEVRELACDFIAACDGFHGIGRAAVSDGLRVYERHYPFGWLGILADAPPATEELVYSRHETGFSLLSMRSPQMARLYLQCDPEDDLKNWPDERIWAELHTRLEVGGGPAVPEGPILQKSITAMRSFVVEPMQAGRLFLAGDAAHIVPPTGAKGMNLAVGDIVVLARALAGYFRQNRTDGLETYSDVCLRRIWKAQRFSWWMTSMLHIFPDATAFDDRLQLAELDYVTGSRPALQALAENYVGLPFG